MGELLTLAGPSPDESFAAILKEATMDFCVGLLGRAKAGEADAAREGFQWLETQLPESVANLFRPAFLALEVLEKGEEQALAREPEEVRRVVRMLLEKLP